MLFRIITESRYAVEGAVGSRKFRAVRTPSDTGVSIHGMDGNVGLTEEELAVVVEKLKMFRPALFSPDNK